MSLLIIPCLNEERYLANLVNGLLRNAPDASCRIVIADGGSTDKSRSIAETLAAQNPGRVFFIDNPGKIQSAAVNLAVARYGDGETYFIRLDAHSDYPPDFCATLLSEAEKSQAASVVVAMNTVGVTPFQRAVAAAQNSRLGNGGSPHRRGDGNGKWVDHGHHALMRVDAFRAIGGYDETFSHNEDAELDHRLSQAGHRIWLTAKTALTYYPRSTPAALFRQYMNFGEGRAKTIFKHATKLKMRQAIPVGIAPAVLLALLTPLTWLAAVPLLLWGGGCIAYGLWLSRRARDNAIALSGLAAMIMHFAWSLGFWKGVLSLPTAGGKSD